MTTKDNKEDLCAANARSSVVDIGLASVLICLAFKRMLPI